MFQSPTFYIKYTPMLLVTKLFQDLYFLVDVTIINGVPWHHKRGVQKQFNLKLLPQCLIKNTVAHFPIYT